ncbi:MAG TPA: cysteine dioxygenase family protein [Gemmatales bacterium]|mgnify:CR=1 FL=1|nr:cysteine dioxygenase family protein [Gemmatales bacterium]
MIPPVLTDLCAYLDSCTGPVNLDRLQHLLEAQPITRDDLAEFCQFGTTTYCRNIVARSDWYEMLCICWRAGHKSYIHDHHGSSCAFKVIAGTATEIICTPTGRTRADQPLVRPVNVTRYPAGAVCGSASFHIHEVVNESARGEDLITLHIYSPPLAMRIYAYDDESAPSHSTPQREAVEALA